ncbi:MAG: peroxiredoxin [Deltaproteobacteria bacterium]|nr:peroxiredoxin [Deltaproteobacteria bacterium]
MSPTNALAATTASENPVAAGDAAPAFSLRDQDGKLWSLTDLLAGQKALVLFFYPADETYGCTKEACSFRDSHDVFVEAGARVVGISSDSVASHARFAGKHSLNYTLLSDAGGVLAGRFGAPNAFGGLIKGRTTYVIDASGTVRGVFSSLLQFTRHIDEALAAVRALQGRTTNRT